MSGSPPVTISKALIDAYRATHFVVASNPEVLLLVGVHSISADSLLLGRGSTSGCIVTAWNPFSETLPPAENARRQERLIQAVDQMGLMHLAAEGRDPDGKWLAEISLCVFDAPNDAIDDWLRRFEQNAVVVFSVGQAAELRFHPDRVRE